MEGEDDEKEGREEEEEEYLTEESESSEEEVGEEPAEPPPPAATSMGKDGKDTEVGNGSLMEKLHNEKLFNRRPYCFTAVESCLASKESIPSWY